MSSFPRRHEQLTVGLLLTLVVLVPTTLLAQDQENLVHRSLPLLSEKVRSLDQSIYPAFFKYAISVLKPDWIKSEDDLGLLFRERESIIKMIEGSEPACNFLSEEIYRWNYKDQSGDWDKYEKEFEHIGIITVMAEGMFAGLAEGPVLEEIVSRVASEPYRLYLRLIAAYAKSYGSEYTFMNLRPEMEAIELAEGLVAQYPESKYLESAKQILGKALFPLTDWHVMLPEDPALVEKSDYRPVTVVGELHQRAFPYMSDIGEPKYFLEAYPESIFREIVTRIVEEPSELICGKSVHLVVVDEFTDEESARQAILNYLLKGLDIPHLITLNENSYLVVYRFFADPEKAEKALGKIRKFKPSATIREKYPPEY